MASFASNKVRFGWRKISSCKSCSYFSFKHSSPVAVMLIRETADVNTSDKIHCDNFDVGFYLDLAEYPAPGRYW